MTAKPEAARVSADDAVLLDRIERGDREAFGQLVGTHGPALLRMAAHHAPSKAAAEDVVQETWMAFLQGLDRFEGRSSVRTWLFGILINQARKTARRERRAISLQPVPASDAELGLDAQRFMPAGGRWEGHWRLDDLAVWPKAWDGLPEDRVLREEVQGEIVKALEPLPASQRIVFTLRDVEGFTAHEVCQLLEITESNQRVLLHRARSRIRAHLEVYLDE